MLRAFRWILAAAAVLAVAPPASRAQFGNGYVYPGGYAGYGWGGWGGGGGLTGSVPGSIARGMGYYAMGAGIYNEETAVANSINADTVMRFNEYLYESQLEANRRERLRMARRQDRNAQAADAIERRLRENPTPEDISGGNALNILLDDLSDPRIHSSALRTATTPIKASTVRAIPFTSASDAVTFSLSQLVANDESWPPALRDDAFEPEREAYRRAVDKALKEDEEGTISAQTIREVRAAVTKLRQKADKTLKKPSPEYIQAQQYIRALAGMSRMLDNPNIEPVLKELETMDNTTVGQLLGFMQNYNLRFGPATTPEQRAIYGELYPTLLNQRDRVVKEAGLPPKDTARAERRGNPTDFFRGLEENPELNNPRGNAPNRNPDANPNPNPPPAPNPDANPNPPAAPNPDANPNPQ